MPSASAAWRAANSRALAPRSGSAPNLDAEAELGMLGADAQADEQVEIGRGNAVRRGRANDLLQLLDRVEAEGLHAMLEIGLGDGLLGLHRVHEAQHGLGQGLVDQPHLADRGDVVMRDARFPQDLQQVGRRDSPSPHRASGPGTSRRRSGPRAARRADAASVTGWTGRLLGDVGTTGLPRGAAASPSAR